MLTCSVTGMHAYNMHEAVLSLTQFTIIVNISLDFHNDRFCDDKKIDFDTNS